MQRVHIARVVAAGALLLATAGAGFPRTASAQTVPPDATSQPGQVEDPQYYAPLPPGETAGNTGTPGTESQEPVDMAPGETGTDQQVPSQFLGAE